MKSASKHPKEEQRLQSLAALKILDTLPEKEFDEIALIAAQICSAPISFISLIDENRQWFKAKVGIESVETSRDLSFCGHTILENEALVVPDASEDERFRESPFLVEAGVRFYAGVPLMAPDGMPVGTVCVVDKTERTLTEGQLSALKALSNQVTRILQLKIQNENLKDLTKRAKYKRSIIENLSEGIMLFDSSGSVIECNEAAIQILGLEMRAQPVARFSMDSGWKSIAEDGQKFPESELPTGKCLRTGEKQKNVVLGIYRTPTDLRWLAVNSIPLFLEGNLVRPSHVVTSFTDVTEIRALDSNRRYLEAKLTDSGRLSALGEMAGGIAHEINNPLGIIMGKTHLLKQKLEAGTLSKDGLIDFEKIELTVERIAKIIKSLKLYSRNAENDPVQTANLSEIINETLDLCSARFRSSGIEVKITCDSDLTIECRSVQISQLLMNLLNNSFDALQGLPNKWIHIAVENKDSEYEVTVTDSGMGIPNKLASKMMQPFYSTKELGKGMGLGLSIALGIAEGHGGKFVYDRQCKNTKFVLTLPKSQEEGIRAS